jgi:superfamily II DNA/RNA helicase
MNFKELGLEPALVRVCESLGFSEPTPIQNQTIPIILDGEDLIACAETGTGKTAACGISPRSDARTRHAD